MIRRLVGQRHVITSLVRVTETPHRELLTPAAHVRCCARYYAKKATKTAAFKLSSLGESDAVDLQKLLKRMDSVLAGLRQELGRLSVKVTPGIFDSVRVTVGDQQIPVPQLGQVTSPNPNTIVINLTGQTEVVPLVVKAVEEMDLGLNPQQDGDIIKIAVPKTTTEYRAQMVKVTKATGEKKRVTLRIVRKEGIEKAKKSLQVPKDEISRATKSVEQLTKHFSSEIDQAIEVKCKELMGTG